LIMFTEYLTGVCPAIEKQMVSGEVTTFRWELVVMR